MFQLKDTKEVRVVVQQWTVLKKKKYLESMKAGLSTSSSPSPSPTMLTFPSR